MFASLKYLKNTYVLSIALLLIGLPLFATENLRCPFQNENQVVDVIGNNKEAREALVQAILGSHRLKIKYLTPAVVNEVADSQKGISQKEIKLQTDFPKIQITIIDNYNYKITYPDDTDSGPEHEVTDQKGFHNFLAKLANCPLIEDFPKGTYGIISDSKELQWGAQTQFMFKHKNDPEYKLVETSAYFKDFFLTIKESAQKRKDIDHFALENIEYFIEINKSYKTCRLFEVETGALVREISDVDCYKKPIDLPYVIFLCGSESRFGFIDDYRNPERVTPMNSIIDKNGLYHTDFQLQICKFSSGLEVDGKIGVNFPASGASYTNRDAYKIKLTPKYKKISIVNWDRPELEMGKILVIKKDKQTYSVLIKWLDKEGWGQFICVPSKLQNETVSFDEKYSDRLFEKFCSNAKTYKRQNVEIIEHYENLFSSEDKYPNIGYYLMKN